MKARKWEEVRKELFSPEQIAESDMRVSIMSELIKARNEQGITQKQLEDMSGVKQPVIARIERNINSPQTNTLIKLLYPMGYTIRVVPIDKK